MFKRTFRSSISALAAWAAGALSRSGGRQGPAPVRTMKLDFVPPAQEKTALAPMPTLRGPAHGIPPGGGFPTGIAKARRDKRRRRNIQKRQSNRK